MFFFFFQLKWIENVLSMPNDNRGHYWVFDFLNPYTSIFKAGKFR